MGALFVTLAALWTLAPACLAAAPASQEDLDTPFVITPTNVVTAMLDLANVKAGDRLIDLGSGDGRIVIAAAQRGATGTGIEIDANLVERSRDSARRLKLADRASFVTQDLFETGFAGYDVVTLYLLPDVNRRLAPKFLATLAPGARIVSHDYGLGDWPPDRTIVVDAPDKPVNVEKQSTIHFWTVPARVAGRWKGRAARNAIELDVAQTYQYISGALRYEGRKYRFAEQRVDGERVTVRIDRPGRRTLALGLRLSGQALVGVLRESRVADIAVELRRADAPR